MRVGTMAAYCVSALVAWLALHVTLALHEWAHLECARLFGVPAPRVVLGVGPALFRVRRRGTTWHVFLIPLFGYVCYLPWRRMPPAIKIYLALAGPFANILVALLLIDWFPPGRDFHNYCCGLISQALTMHSALRQGVFTALRLFAYSNLGLGLVNLLPIWPMDGSLVVEETVRLLRRLVPRYRPSPLWWRVWSRGGLVVTVGTSVVFLLSDVTLLWTQKQDVRFYESDERPQVRKKRVKRVPREVKPAGRERRQAVEKKPRP